MVESGISERPAVVRSGNRSGSNCAYGGFGFCFLEYSISYFPFVTQGNQLQVDLVREESRELLQKVQTRFVI